MGVFPAALYYPHSSLGFLIRSQKLVDSLRKFNERELTTDQLANLPSDPASGELGDPTKTKCWPLAPFGYELPELPVFYFALSVALRGGVVRAREYYSRTRQRRNVLFAAFPSEAINPAAISSSTSAATTLRSKCSPSDSC